ncbi:NPC intracellular cholesterol transporter 2-like [Mercenaria mercenaria]|uniref:NPC intracellular cholesterol transporter 2-like n=1 Tax=Mercenaria mercenaria TaxID=6596 RepID=UPI001E1DA790|nr:NPC intracellular cholesterol transporter 2-like [Mercenaria mercenaria]
MIKVYILFVLSVVPCSISIQLLNYADCGSSAIIHSILLEPCDATPCIIHQLQNYTARINFTARANHKRAFNFASSVTTGLNDKWSVPTFDACTNDLKCPIQAGLAQIYTITVTCPLARPSRVAAKWEVKTGDDPNDPDIICFVFPVEIV